MCHPPRTQNLSSIAVLGQDRLPHAGAGEKTVKDLIYNLGNAFKNISAVDPFMVKSSGREMCIRDSLQMERGTDTGSGMPSYAVKGT